MIHDPAIFYDEVSGNYYTYSTGAICQKSKDLVHWQEIGKVVERPPQESVEWTGSEDIWAPDIVKVGKEYRLYCSNSSWGVRQSCIFLAVADRPEGPFEPKGCVLKTTEKFPQSVTNAIDANIIEDAKNHLEAKDESFEDLLTSLENSRVTIEKEQEEILEYRKEIETLRKSLKSRQDNIKEKRDKMLRDAREEAHNIISEAKEIADSTIREYNKLKKQNKNPDANKKMEHMRSDLRGRMTKLEGQMAYKSKKKNKKRHEANDFHVGDEVYVTSLSLAGTVSTLPNAKGDLYVQMGMMRSLVNIKDLEITKTAKDVKRENQRNESRNRGRTAINKSASIRPEINVMGMTVDEAIAQLDKYIDDACLANLAQITVVHGKGTGALRKGLHNYFKQLKKQKRISGYRDGEYGEGDLGVTVVIL